MTLYRQEIKSCHHNSKPCVNELYIWLVWAHISLSQKLCNWQNGNKMKGNFWYFMNLCIFLYFDDLNLIEFYFSQMNVCLVSEKTIRFVRERNRGKVKLNKKLKIGKRKKNRKEK